MLFTCDSGMAFIIEYCVVGKKDCSPFQEKADEVASQREWIWYRCLFQECISKGHTWTYPLNSSIIISLS